MSVRLITNPENFHTSLTVDSSCSCVFQSHCMFWTNQWLDYSYWQIGPTALKYTFHSFEAAPVLALFLMWWWPCSQPANGPSFNPGLLEEAESPRGSVPERLGRKMPSTGKFAPLLNLIYRFHLSANNANFRVEIRSSWLVLGVDVKSREGVPLRRSLAERLGRVVDQEAPLMPLKKGE